MSEWMFFKLSTSWLIKKTSITLFGVLIFFAAIPAVKVGQAQELQVTLRKGEAVGIAVEPLVKEQADNGRWLRRQINKAKKGSTVLIPEGYYQLQDLQIRKSVKLLGEGDVILQSLRPVQKGLLVPLQGVSLQVENITFRGARSPDRNGAGIRHEGLNLTVIDCIFEENENGILATGSPKGRVEIRNSTFLNSGNGDGYSHGIYIRYGKELSISGTRFIGTRIGHHVKTLTDKTSVRESYFDDAGAGSSYTIDITAGGSAVITDNFIMQRETVENATIINYDASRGGPAQSLRIVGNRIVNRHAQGRFFRNASDIKTVVENNIITNEGSGRLKVDKN